MAREAGSAETRRNTTPGWLVAPATGMAEVRMDPTILEARWTMAGWERKPEGRHPALAILDFGEGSWRPRLGRERPPGAAAARPTRGWTTCQVAQSDQRPAETRNKQRRRTLAPQGATPQIPPDQPGQEAQRCDDCPRQPPLRSSRRQEAEFPLSQPEGHGAQRPLQGAAYQGRSG